MIILRESSIDATYTTIEEFATSMWNSKNIMHDSNGKLEVNIKSKIKTVEKVAINPMYYLRPLSCF